MDPATAINNGVITGDMEGEQAQVERPAEEGGVAAPEPVAEVVDGGDEDDEEEYGEPSRDAMFKIYNMLHEDKEINGELMFVPIEYLKLETAQAIMAEFEKPGALHDDESAHSNEDAMNAAFIRGVALSKYTLEEAREIAQLISGVGRMGFARWCA